jgi:response regulator RpfG family c-di-GMP phosphodiesterase
MEVETKIVSSEDEKLNLLLLDDENDILKALTRVLRLDYNVVSFNSGHDALAYLKENEISIIISDMRMPEMDGADFLAAAKEIQPNAIRILLTGYSDIQSTVRAVNSGGIHTYISKPWDNENLKLVVGKACEFFRLRQERERLADELEERNSQLEQMNETLAVANSKLSDFNQALELEVDQRTKELQESHSRLEILLKGRNKTLRDILSMVMAIIQHRTGSPADHAERIANLAKAVAKKLALSEQIISNIYLCSLMYQIGLIGASDKDLEQPKFDHNNHTLMAPSAHAELGAKIVGLIKRFEPLVEMMLHQDEHFNGTGKPGHLHGADIPIGARIIKVVKDYDYFVASPHNRLRMTTKSAQKYLKEQAGELYDPKVVDIFLNMVSVPSRLTKGLELGIGLADLTPGTQIKRDLYLPNGKLMLTAGHVINGPLLSKLKEIEKESGMPIVVFIG